jgi:hypothetical protein
LSVKYFSLADKAAELEDTGTVSDEVVLYNHLPVWVQCVLYIASSQNLSWLRFSSGILKPSPRFAL